MADDTIPPIGTVKVKIKDATGTWQYISQANPLGLTPTGTKAREFTRTYASFTLSYSTGEGDSTTYYLHANGTGGVELSSSSSTSWELSSSKLQVSGDNTKQATVSGQGLIVGSSGGDADVS